MGFLNYLTTQRGDDYQLTFQSLVGKASSAFLVGLSLITLFVINIFAPAQNQLLPSVLTTALLLAGVLSILKPAYRRPIYIVIFFLSSLLLPVLFHANGILPILFLAPLVMLPLMLIGGRYGELLALLIFLTALTPLFTEVQVDLALWSRTLIASACVGLVVAAMIRYVNLILHKNYEVTQSLNQSLSDREEALIAFKEEKQKQAQMFSIIGHELRTPLSSMKMMEEAMGLRTLGEYGANICESTDAVLSIVDDLRTVINPDKAHEALAVVDSPFDVLTRTTRSLEGLYEQQGVEVQVTSNQLAHTLCKFNAQALRQKITNLTKNAAIHADADRVWVDLQAQPHGDDKIKLTLRVEDNGKGIPDGLREAVFGAFSRGDTRAEGTGLGLYITRELAHKLGGTVAYFESSKGGAGFKVEFTLDLHLDAGDREQVAEVIPVALQGKRILFAEDQKTLQLLTSKLLQDAGAIVVVCDNGKQALEAFRAGEFDIVLTDLMMPEMNGDELIRNVRADGFTGQVVALTAAIIGKETDVLLEAGADAVLNKPLDVHEMKRTIAVLEHKEKVA